jgi:Abnormal spindle-like microcephaly-assoc'd, ASPM-SPD-2-Hydin/Protein of unknown function (DUF1573)
MVGMRFSKCLHCKSLLKLLLVLASSSLYLAQARTTGKAMTGRAVGAEPSTASLPLVEVTPEAVNFPDVPMGDTYTQTVKITNVGDNTLQITKINTSADEFRITGILLPVVVAHGTSESFTISFHPQAEGRRDGRISIFTSSAEAPLILNVRASTITEQTELTASEAAIEFADVAIGSAGKQELSLTNVGNRNATISAISVTGLAFSVFGASAMRLAPGQTASLEVNFAPKSVGKQSGQLTVLGPDGSTLVLIPLTAAGAEWSSRAVKLNWEESPVTVAGYVVYRSADSSGPYTRLSESGAPEFLDTGLAAGHTYFYVVTSLDADAVESEYSPPISATVPEG